MSPASKIGCSFGIHLKFQGAIFNYFYSLILVPFFHGKIHDQRYISPMWKILHPWKLTAGTWKYPCANVKTSMNHQFWGSGLLVFRAVFFVMSAPTINRTVNFIPQRKPSGLKSRSAASWVKSMGVRNYLPMHPDTLLLRCPWYFSLNGL